MLRAHQVPPVCFLQILCSPQSCWGACAHVSPRRIQHAGSQSNNKQQTSNERTKPSQVNPPPSPTCSFFSPKCFSLPRYILEHVRMFHQVHDSIQAREQKTKTKSTCSKTKPANPPPPPPPRNNTKPAVKQKPENPKAQKTTTQRRKTRTKPK